MSSHASNGGLPEPPPGEPVRVVSCAHLTCGTDTRVRLPAELPAAAVRRVVCGGCGRSFECRLVTEVSAPRPPRPDDDEERRRGWLDRHPGRAWRFVSVPIAAVAVIAILALIRALGG